MDTTVRGSADFGVIRSWAGDYDGGDLGAVVRASRLLYSVPCDFHRDMLDVDDARVEFLKDENLYNDMFTRSECLTPAMVGKLNDHVVQKANCFAAIDGTPDETQKAEINDSQIMPFCTKELRHREEPSSKQQSSSSATLSMSVNLKSPARYDSLTVEDSVLKEMECTSAAVRMDSNGDGLSFAKIPGTKRRKIQQRRIMCVPAAGGSWNKQGGVGVPSDLWAWRKYGQKPIKGSPHPRGYYRCSSSKGCPARKQIERSHTDPTMLVITYTADHNHAWPTHRNALAGSTRQNAFQPKVQTLPVPNTNTDTNSDVAVAPLHSPSKDNNPPDIISSFPINESDQRKQETGSPNCVENSLGCNLSDSGFDAFNSNHMHEDDLFADLGELPECLRDFTAHSDEETVSTVVDPFNIFDWSSSTME